MGNRNSRFEFVALLLFLVAVALVLSNAFVGRIFADDEQVDVYQSMEPLADALDKIMDAYVEEPDLDKLVEGALSGMMRSLDPHSSYLPPMTHKDMMEETEGKFEGIGVHILQNDAGEVVVVQPVPGLPAALAGVMAGDIIIKVDGESTEGQDIGEVASHIKGKRGTKVDITVYRPEEEGEGSELTFTIERGTIPLESVEEVRLLDGGIGYIRLNEFSKTSARELKKAINELSAKGMKSLVLDMRWNLGGLLTASKEVSELFLPKGTLVVSTRGRDINGSHYTDNLPLSTEREPIIPENLPMIIITSRATASAAEIVTAALQYWQRAIIVGEQTFGKGSVQTVVPLRRPEGSALRLTTALYYTPADVTINLVGIKPDVEVKMTGKEHAALRKQLFESYRDNIDNKNAQNHGTVTGNELTDDMVEDASLQKAVEILKEDPVFANLLKKYHKDTSETQVAAADVKAKEALEKAESDATGQ